MLKLESRQLWYAALLLAAGLGLVARLGSLGASSLAIDEYYLLTSAQNILRHAGLPEFDCAGFYTRGLLHQYASAGLMLLGMDPETAIRLPSVIADIASVAGAFLLAKYIGGWRVAIFITIILCLSLWQVEFARFGRMYALFQACTVWYTLAAVKFLESSDRSSFTWMLVVSLIAVFGHEGGALLAAFSLFTLMLVARRPALIQIAAAIAILVIATAMLVTDLRYFDVGNPYSQELLRTTTLESGASFIDMPSMNLLAGFAGIVMVVVMTVGSTAWLSRTYLRETTNVGAWRAALAVIAWGAVIAALTLQWFLLAGWLLLIALLFGVIHPRALTNKKLLASLVVIAGLLLAIGLALAHFAGEGISDAIKDGLRYPDFYLEVYLPWMKVMPGLGLATAIVLGTATWIVLFGSTDSSDSVRYRLLLGITLALLLGAVLSRQPYYSTRYTYFIYPLLLILLAQGALIIQRRYLPQTVLAPISWLLVAAAFVFSNDFDMKHLLRIDAPEYLYRTKYPPAVANHFYDRWDYRGVAAQVDFGADPDDLVITTAYPVIPFYSRLIDVVYLDRTDSRIWIVSCNEGSRDLWSNLPLIYEPELILSTIENARRTVWLVVRTEKYKARKPIEAKLLAQYGSNEVFRSIDGHLALLKIP